MSGMAMTMMAAILLIATATGPALEAPASAISASAAVATAISATVRASPPATAVTAATSERSLETGAGIAAYARGLAREFAERFRRLSGNTGACFAGK